MAERSFPQWQHVFGETEPPLFHKTGVLWIARQDDEYVKNTRDIFAAAKIKFEIMDAADLAKRYPQIQVREPNVFGMFEPESGALMARRAVAAVVGAAVEIGVQFARAAVRLDLASGSKFGQGRPSLKTMSGGFSQELARTTEPDSAGSPRIPDGSEGRAGPARASKELARTTEPDSAGSLRVSDGSEGRAGPVRTIEADQLVFACGPWLPKLFPGLLGSRIFPTRQEVLFFAPPAGDGRFAPGRFPAWIDFTDPRVPYGFPDIESRGVKFAFDRHGPEFDPDSGGRLVSSASIDEARTFLAERFPALREAPLAETRVCQYENTSNGDFLIDRHPDLENVWLVGGGSGHGFKHGPAVGEYAANRIAGKGAAEERFSYRTKGVVQNRTVF
jgi:glycine/D-amino acid oxidase-like deaminating enzyme